MDINLARITASIVHFLQRFHVILFVVIVLGALGAGVFITYQNILATDDARGYTAQTNNATFDTATSAKIQALHPSDYRLPSSEPSDQVIPERALPIHGNINPFVE